MKTSRNFATLLAGLDLAAKKYRVIAFDRPGFGRSDRPRSTIWTPEAQADLIAAALKEMGVPGAMENTAPSSGAH